jgi:hypothetical protein
MSGTGTKLTCRDVRLKSAFRELSRRGVQFGRLPLATRNDVRTPHSSSSVDRPETRDEVLHALKGVGLKKAIYRRATVKRKAAF